MYNTSTVTKKILNCTSTRTRTLCSTERYSTVRLKWRDSLSRGSFRIQYDYWVPRRSRNTRDTDFRMHVPDLRRWELHCAVDKNWRSRVSIRLLHLNISAVVLWYGIKRIIILDDSYLSGVHISNASRIDIIVGQRSTNSYSTTIGSWGVQGVTATRTERVGGMSHTKNFSESNNNCLLNYWSARSYLPQWKTVIGKMMPPL